MLLVCRGDLEDGLVYDLTRHFHEALPRLVRFEPALGVMDPTQAPATPIPLHTGATRYYRERAMRPW
jgi:TRAP-type uncharacterized transport system substrate-binding protein